MSLGYSRCVRARTCGVTAILLLGLLAVCPPGALAQSAPIADASVRATEQAAQTVVAAAVLELDLTTRYEHLRVGGERVEQFALPRAEFGVRGDQDTAIGYELRLEALRAGGPQSAFGVDGDSILLRVRRAGVSVQHTWGTGVTIQLAAGLLGEPWLRSLEDDYGLRGVAPLRSEAEGLYVASDLGVALRADACDRRFRLQLSYGNGEGRTRTEQNTGKNLSAALRIEPLRFRWRGEDAALAIHAMLRDGSRGINSARDHRRSVALTFAHPTLHAGTELAWAKGFDERPDRSLRTISAWTSAIVWDPWVGVLVLGGQSDLDTSRARSNSRALSVGLFTALDRAVDLPTIGHARIYVTYERRGFDANAVPLAGAPEAFETDGVMVTLALSAAHALPAHSHTTLTAP